MQPQMDLSDQELRFLPELDFKNQNGIDIMKKNVRDVWPFFVSTIHSSMRNRDPSWYLC